MNANRIYESSHNIFEEEKTPHNPLSTSINDNPIHIIQENSLEISYSKQDSNNLEHTRQL